MVINYSIDFVREALNRFAVCDDRDTTGKSGFAVARRDTPFALPP
jgi:hypothetical protein